MTVEVDHSEKPSLIVPKKRAGGRKGGTAPSHVDHIIMIQGSSNMTSAKIHSLAELGGVVENHKINSNLPMKTNGFKNNIMSELPVIPDGDEKVEINMTEQRNAKNQERPQNLPKMNHQICSNLSNSREIVDLSPIYENSSDYSSHDDVRSSNNELTTQRSCTILIEDGNESNSLTPNSLSQAHSEASLEMGLLSGDCSISKGSMKKAKKRVNIVSEANINSNRDDAANALKYDSELSESPDKSTFSNAGDGYLTLNGTIKRGKKKGQNVDIILNMSREELEVLEANIVADEMNKARIGFGCSSLNGPHVVLWSLLCAPLVALVSGAYSFYTGTITWYNIFTRVSEERNTWLKVFGSPVVIFLYPLLIILFTVGLGIYAGVVQIRYSGTAWWKEVCDLEKGFYGWLCGILQLSDCSPYEVVILTDLKAVENTDMRGHSSTEDISV